MGKFQRDLGIALILYFGLITTLGTCILQSQGTKLRLVSAIFRHGDRTVEPNVGESYPNDPYKDYDYYPDGNGQLTNDGKKRAYKLGLTLRNRYNSFLGNIYYQPNIYAQSTMVVRTKTSLQVIFAALYPPAALQEWNPLLLWQPVDFTYTNITHDELLFPYVCPVYLQLYNDMLQNNVAIKKKVAEFADLMKKVSIYTGKNMTTIYDLYSIYQTLEAEAAFGLRLPEWTQSLFPNGALMNATILHYDLFSYGILKTLNGGPLLRKIINDMNAMINGTLKDRKLNLFSGHDADVAGIMYALNIFDEQVVRYTSSIMIELHEKNGEFFVKVVHYLGIPSTIIEKCIPGCEILCPYNKFIQLISAVTATNEELKCS
ncbi:venom acid phosphatase Acph-1-like isoform X2 [Camponotus floridanus]|uniref:venom acid phosphatase Acph-1-like isoform X2 n=1 Tax=Camponotus floridanus TaxID=104421 RepID=UPI000DC69794|nr:venom acid phosphatase Acph-1-like isoform X2 [Camponotus floridanus]